jgi:hypothetical protein
VVDTDGVQVVSNEVVMRGSNGRYEWPFPLRATTEALLREHGYQRSERVAVVR